MSGGNDERQVSWLYRRENRKKLWWAFGLVLAATVVAQLAVHVHGHFGFDERFGFNAFYGFITCTLMVVFAKVLGFVLKRPEDFYDRDV